MDDNLEVIVDKIAESYSVEDRTHETDEKDIIILKVVYFDVIKALHKL